MKLASLLGLCIVLLSISSMEGSPLPSPIPDPLVPSLTPLLTAPIVCPIFFADKAAKKLQAIWKILNP